MVCRRSIGVLLHNVSVHVVIIAAAVRLSNLLKSKLSLKRGL